MATFRMVLVTMMTATVAAPAAQAEDQRPGDDEPLPPQEQAPAGPPPRLDLPPPDAVPKQSPPQSVLGRAMRLQHDIEGRFRRDADLAARHIVVVADARGGVTLIGEVENNAERNRATRLARNAGASHVSNQLKTVPPRGQSTTGANSTAPAAPPPATKSRTQRPASDDPDQVITDHIEAALEAEPTTARADVRVDTVNGSVILRGTVPSEAARARAVDIARSTPGVTKVIEDLIVPAQP